MRGFCSRESIGEGQNDILLMIAEFFAEEIEAANEFRVGLVADPDGGKTGCDRLLR